jgi:hypothetical protein
MVDSKYNKVDFPQPDLPTGHKLTIINLQINIFDYLKFLRIVKYLINPLVSKAVSFISFSSNNFNGIYLLAFMAGNKPEIIVVKAQYYSDAVVSNNIII